MALDRALVGVEAPCWAGVGPQLGGGMRVGPVVQGRRMGQRGSRAFLPCWGQMKSMGNEAPRGGVG